MPSRTRNCRNARCILPCRRHGCSWRGILRAGPAGTRSKKRAQTTDRSRGSMRRRSMRVLAALLPALLAAGCSASRAVPSWYGAYEYVDNGGATAAGTGVGVAYRLEIPASAASQGILRITGFQRDETIRCDVSAAAAEMTVRFR